MFNRRREGEVSRMKLSDYDKRKECAENSEISESLSKLEKSLCKLLTRIEICGKGGRNVPVLPTPSMKSSIDILRKYRKEVGVWEENEFLFASCSYKAKYHYRGSDCLRKFAEECGAEKADLLRFTKLRKHVATMSQILNYKKTSWKSSPDLWAMILGFIEIFIGCLTQCIRQPNCQKFSYLWRKEKLLNIMENP